MSGNSGLVIIFPAKVHAWVRSSGGWQCLQTGDDPGARISLRKPERGEMSKGGVAGIWYARWRIRQKPHPK